MLLAPTAHLRTLRTLRRLATLSALACSAVALSACGGGSRVKPYEPQRMVSFGDENSLIDSFTEATLSKLHKTDGVTAGSVKGLVYTLNTVAVGPIDGNALGVYYVCANSSSASYTACNSSNATGGSVTAISGDDWYEDPDFANRLIHVEHDTLNGTRLDALLAWNCSGSVIWTQVIAHAFHLGYAGTTSAPGACPTDSYTGAVTYATYGAKIADTVSQVNSHLGELGNGTLVTIMAGQWDVLELNQSVTNGSTDINSALADIIGRADNLIGAIQAITNAGAKVVVAFTPDLGESPKAYAASANGPSGNLYRLAYALNNRLYQLGNDRVIPKLGRVVAIVDPYTLTNTTTRSTAYVYGAAICPPEAVASSASAPTPVLLQDPVGNAVTRLGTPGYTDESAVKYCNTSGSTTLPSNYTSYMWADSVHFSPLGHGSIGSLAYSRASNQF